MKHGRPRDRDEGNGSLGRELPPPHSSYSPVHISMVCLPEGNIPGVRLPLFVTEIILTVVSSICSRCCNFPLPACMATVPWQASVFVTIEKSGMGGRFTLR